MLLRDTWNLLSVTLRSRFLKTKDELLQTVATPEGLSTTSSAALQ